MYLLWVWYSTEICKVHIEYLPAHRHGSSQATLLADMAPDAMPRPSEVCFSQWRPAWKKQMGQHLQDKQIVSSLRQV